MYPTVRTAVSDVLAGTLGSERRIVDRLPAMAVPEIRSAKEQIQNVDYISDSLVAMLVRCMDGYLHYGGCLPSCIPGEDRGGV